MFETEGVSTHTLTKLDHWTGKRCRLGAAVRTSRPQRSYPSAALAAVQPARHRGACSHHATARTSCQGFGGQAGRAWSVPPLRRSGRQWGWVVGSRCAGARSEQAIGCRSIRSRATPCRRTTLSQYRLNLGESVLYLVQRGPHRVGVLVVRILHRGLCGFDLRRG